MIKKSVICPVAYDAPMLLGSIKTYYDYVDQIVIGLDENRITFNNQPYSIDENKLWNDLQTLDGDNKIDVIEHNFHQSAIPIENDNYTRNYLKSQCDNDWIFSFDADEYLINAKKFFHEYVPVAERYYKKADFLFTWFHPFKEFEDCYLVIANNDGSFTRCDQRCFAVSKEKTFVFGAWTENQRRILSPLAIMHWSFCREEKDLYQKLHNFGHSDKTPNDPFFHNWKACNLENYTGLRNFKTSGFGPENQWERLVRVPKEQLYAVAEQQAEMIM